jgi:hypothetical protein
MVGGPVPLDHGYLLFGALSNVLGDLHNANWLAVHPLYGLPRPDGMLALPRGRAVQVFREQPQRLADAASGAVEEHEERPIPDASRRAIRTRADECSDFVGGENFGGVVPALVRWTSPSARGCRAVRLRSTLVRGFELRFCLIAYVYCTAPTRNKRKRNSVPRLWLYPDRAGSIPRRDRGAKTNLEASRSSL